MDHNNDKTMFGLYRGYKKGIDEPNSRRDYRNKFEGNLNSKTFRKNDMFSGFFRISSTINNNVALKNFKDTVSDYFFHGFRYLEKQREYEYNYFYVLTKYFPKSKLVTKFNEQESFGMSSYDKNCDCCGKEMNILNGSGYGVCMHCKETHLDNTQKSFGENKHIRELILGF